MAHQPEHVPGLNFGVLGPLQVLRDGTSCAPTALKQRALLALLLFRSNEVVPTAMLVDGLWRDSPPPCALPALQGYVSAVRRLLEPRHRPAAGDPRRHPVLRTEPSGYLVRVLPDQLDLARFRSSATLGRALVTEDRCDEAQEAFGQALALWRGPALADLHSVGTLDGYSVRLEEDRLAVLQERIGADLCLGRGPQLIGELEELCTGYPLREVLYEQLMVALWSAGRRAEALAVYPRARQVMVGEAGIEPGPGLRRTQQAILAGSELRDIEHRHRHPGAAVRRTPLLRSATRHPRPVPGSRISQSRRRR